MPSPLSMRSQEPKHGDAFITMSTSLDVPSRGQVELLLHTPAPALRKEAGVEPRSRLQEGGAQQAAHSIVVAPGRRAHAVSGSSPQKENRGDGRQMGGRGVP